MNLHHLQDGFFNNIGAVFGLQDRWQIARESYLADKWQEEIFGQNVFLD
eukprot:XP_001706416.1 Hypothetical protein GL50803_37956 [Giardia lamblia ATCC 50803]